MKAVVGHIEEAMAEATHRCTVPSDHLIPGDLLLIGAGDKVPADPRLMEITKVQVDESPLTDKLIDHAVADVLAKGGTIEAIDRTFPGDTPIAAILRYSIPEGVP